MRKGYFLLLIFILSTIGSINSKNLNAYIADVSDYGQLEQVLGDKWATVDSLVVNGPVNEIDFAIMWKCGFKGNLKSLNLANAQIKDNKIPDLAFWKVNEQTEGYYFYRPLLTKIILPNTITEIGDAAFAHMQIEYINLPKSLQKIGKSCFSFCDFKIDSLVIPEGISEIPLQCFYYADNLKHISFPSTLEIIAPYTFYGMNVEEIKFSNALDSIGDGAFAANGTLKKLELPNSLRYLGKDVFNYCYKLEQVNIPTNLSSIPPGFLGNCQSLKSISIPSSIKVIEEEAFAGSGLEFIDLNEGLLEIKERAFSGCNPTQIVFPASLEKIGKDACSYWSDITKIYSKSLIPPVCDDFATFSSVNSTIPVYVPIGTIDLYRTSLGWNYFVYFIETSDYPTSKIDYIHTDSENLNQKVYFSNEKLVIEGNRNLSTKYSIYSLNGKMLYSGVVNSIIELDIPRTMYIVKLGNMVYKVR